MRPVLRLGMLTLARSPERSRPLNTARTQAVLVKWKSGRNLVDNKDSCAGIAYLF